MTLAQLEALPEEAKARAVELFAKVVSVLAEAKPLLEEIEGLVEKPAEEATAEPADPAAGVQNSSDLA